MSQTRQLGQVDDEYPHAYGYCQCGCGKRTSLLYNGEYAKFCNARHNPRYRTQEERRREAEKERKRETQRAASYVPLSSGTLGEKKPGYELGWGYCQCGCGKETSITQGKAARFVAGHSSRTVEARERSSRLGTELLQTRLRSGSLPLGRSIQGTHFSAMNDREMTFMSTYERRAFEILDVLESVASYEEQPYTITYEYCGAKSQYTPDALVRFKDGHTAILEIKPRSKLASPKVAAKAQAALAFCHERGIRYMIWTEDFLRLQDFKRKTVSVEGPLAELCRLDYIESIIGTTVTEIDTRLAARRHGVHTACHPRA
jgi:hypothetical protein